MWHWAKTGRGQWKMVSRENWEGRQVWPWHRLRSQRSKRTSSSLYIEDHLRILFSVPFIISTLDYWRSNLKNMLDNLQVVRCYYKSTDNFQNLQPAWQAQLETDNDQMQTLKLKVTHSPLPCTLSQHTATSLQVWKRWQNRYEAYSKIPIFTLRQTQANTFMDIRQSLCKQTGGVGSVWIWSRQWANQTPGPRHCLRQGIAQVNTPAASALMQAHKDTYTVTKVKQTQTQKHRYLWV